MWYEERNILFSLVGIRVGVGIVISSYAESLHSLHIEGVSVSHGAINLSQFIKNVKVT